MRILRAAAPNARRREMTIALHMLSMLILTSAAAAGEWVSSPDGRLEFEIPAGYHRVTDVPTLLRLQAEDKATLTLYSSANDGHAVDNLSKNLDSELVFLQKTGLRNCAAEPVRQYAVSARRVGKGAAGRCDSGFEYGVIVVPVGSLAVTALAQGHFAPLLALLGSGRAAAIPAAGPSPAPAQAPSVARTKDGLIEYDIPAGYHTWVGDESSGLALDQGPGWIQVLVSADGVTTPEHLDQKVEERANTLLRAVLSKDGVSCPAASVGQEVSARAAVRGSEGRCSNGAMFGVLASNVSGRMVLVSWLATRAPALATIVSARLARPGGDGGIRGAVASPTELEAPVRPATDLAPLPERGGRGWLEAATLALLVAAGGLAARAVLGRRADIKLTPLAPGSGFPLRAEQKRLSEPVVYHAHDADGAAFVAESSRWAAILFGTGAGFDIGSKILRQLFEMLGVESGAMSISIVEHIGIYMILAGILAAAARRRMKLNDAQGRPIFEITGDFFNWPASQRFRAYKDGAEVFRVRRRRWTILRRKWELLDLQGNVLLEFVEDSRPKSLARKMLGHLWGLLRTNYVLRADGQEIGFVRREWSIWNRFEIDMRPRAELDRRVVLAAVLLMDRIDPDRWHPWHL